MTNSPNSNPTAMAGEAGPSDLDGHIYQRLLKERIVFLGSEVRDANSNAICAQMLLLVKKAKNETEARAQLKKHLASGKAYEVFQEMVRLHGGDPTSLDQLHKIHSASLQEPLPSPASGKIAAVDAERVGKACVVLGAGRVKTDDKVDFAVGASKLMQVGESVEKGQPLVVIHANDENRMEEARKLLDGAFTIRKGPVKVPPLVYETILK